MVALSRSRALSLSRSLGDSVEQEHQLAGPAANFFTDKHVPWAAQVHNTPEGHVTRDYKEGSARLGDLDFRCIDTSGLEPFMAPSSLQARLSYLPDAAPESMLSAHLLAMLSDACWLGGSGVKVCHQMEISSVNSGVWL